MKPATKCDAGNSLCIFMNIAALTLNIQHIYGKGPHQLLWACLRAAHGKNSMWYTYPLKLLCNFCSTYAIYKCGNGLRNTNW